jgi:hypothetical protein
LVPICYLKEKKKCFALVREDWVDYVTGVWVVLRKKSSA